MDPNSKRIIKNTGFLYVRMLLLMFIGLYTSRVILHNLGVEDYGIYNVVGGLTGMFAFFQSSLANATQRFLSVELGKGSKEGATNVFSQFFLIYLFFVFVVLIALETFGYWFVANKLNIPPDRLESALIVFHLTVVSLCFTLIGTAFNSVIIAHEDMSFYSYMGIFNGCVKLIVAYSIAHATHDKLILYASLLLGSVIIVQLTYAIWCFKKYAECRFIGYFDKNTLYNMGKFFSWNFVGTIIYMTKDSLINILINLFFGPAVNAARGVAYQINGVLSQFTNSIYTSVQPQIVKSYASNDLQFMHKLMFTSSKYGVLAFWTIALTVAINIKYLLGMWLIEVPQYTEIFAVWVLVDSCLAILTNAPWGAALATGKLRNYTLYGNGALLLILPLSYFALKLGAASVSVFIITAVVRCLQLILVIRESNILVHFGLKKYSIYVLLPILKVVLSSSILPVLAFVFFDNNFGGLCIKGVVSIISCITAIWYLALDLNERTLAISFLKKRFKHK